MYKNCFWMWWTVAQHLARCDTVSRIYIWILKSSMTPHPLVCLETAIQAGIILNLREGLTLKYIYFLLVTEVRGRTSYIIHHITPWARMTGTHIYTWSIDIQEVSDQFVCYHPILFVTDLSMSLQICIYWIFEPWIHRARHAYHPLIAVPYSDWGGNSFPTTTLNFENPPHVIKLKKSI
jgi:hypothetical protein